MCYDLFHMNGAENSQEYGSGGGSASDTGVMTLQKAVELGEYEPHYLARFPDWSLLSRHVQSQLIRKGLENRWYQLMRKWSDLANVDFYSMKPHLGTAQKKVEEEIKNLEADRERLLEEYA